MRSEPSVLNILSATPCSRNWRGMSTYWTLPLSESYNPLWPSAFGSLQPKQRALIGWRKQFIRLKYIMLYLERTGWKRCSDSFQPYGYVLAHDPFEIRFATALLKHMAVTTRVSAPYIFLECIQSVFQENLYTICFSWIKILNSKTRLLK